MYLVDHAAAHAEDRLDVERLRLNQFERHAPGARLRLGRARAHPYYDGGQRGRRWRRWMRGVMEDANGAARAELYEVAVEERRGSPDTALVVKSPVEAAQVEQYDLPVLSLDLRVAARNNRRVCLNPHLHVGTPTKANQVAVGLEALELSLSAVDQLDV